MIPFKVPNLSNENTRRRIIPLIIPLAILVLTYSVPQEDIKSLMVFVFLVFVFSFYKFDSRILIGYGILLLIIAAIITFGKFNEVASRTAVLSYWILSAGVVSILVDFYRKRRFIQHATHNKL